MIELRHTFRCDLHGLFYKTLPLSVKTPVMASCPTCDDTPVFNTDIDAGPYGMLGGVIQACRCCSKGHGEQSDAKTDPSRV